MKTVAYVRVSSASQASEMQKHAIVVAAKARGDVIAECYEEKASGRTLKRPELQRLIVDAAKGSVARLYVYRLDRLTRSGIRDTLDVVEQLRGYGCTLVTIADGFDVEGPAGEVVLAVIAWAAKMERLAIGERISAARARVKASGGAWGRPRRLSDEQLNMVQALRRDGLTVRQIAVSQKIPRATVFRALSLKGPWCPTLDGPPRKAVRKR